MRHFIPCSSLSNFSTESPLSLLSSALLYRLENWLQGMKDHQLLDSTVKFLYSKTIILSSTVLEIWAVSSTNIQYSCTRLSGDDFLNAAQLELSVLPGKGRVDRHMVFPQCESKCVASGYCSWWIPAGTTDMGNASEGVQKRRKKRQEGEQLQQKWRKELRYPRILLKLHHPEPELRRWLVKSLNLQKMTREERYYGAFWILW